VRGYPGWFYSALLLTMFILILTGGLLTPTLLDLRLEWDMPWRLEGNGQIAVAALHAAVSFWMLTMLGSLWNIHMRAGWRHRQHWRSGVAMALLMLFLLVTAMGIYYLADEQLAMVSAVSHLVAGTLVFMLFVYHAIIGYRRAVQHKPHLHH
jgi:hypothetical protein